MDSAALDQLAVVAHPSGLHVPALDLFLDPHAPAARSFVSHAHGDHVPPAAGAPLLASVETAALLRARHGVEVTRALEWGEPIEWDAPIGRCSLTIAPAGHVLGAAQLVADTPAGRLVYTGDYQSGPGLTHASGAPVPCDVLVIEATFGLPIFHFPPRPSVRAAIVEWCAARLAAGESPVLLAYSLGKAQELIAALGEAGLPIVAHGSCLRVCAAYRELGVALPEVGPASATTARAARPKVRRSREPAEPAIEPDLAAASAPDPRPGVLVAPPWVRGQPLVKKRRDARVGYVSGWARIDAARERFDADAVFPLSDHADFDDLVFTVRTSGARRVYTTFGHAAPFAAIFRELGVDARPLEAAARDAHEESAREDGA